MFHLWEADTILSFIMKPEMPDNLINMCCISLSVAVSQQKESGLCLGASWLTGSDCSGTVGNTHPLERGIAWRHILFWSRLADGSPGERQMGIIPEPDDKRPILMSFFPHCGASLSRPESCWAAWENSSLPTFWIDSTTKGWNRI